jgi:hypothetical protein
MEEHRPKKLWNKSVSAKPSACTAMPGGLRFM